MSDYVIQRGDNLSRIARTHCTDVQTLMRLNPQIKNPNLIFKGDTLKLPEAKMDTFTREAAPQEVPQQPATPAYNPQAEVQEEVVTEDPTANPATVTEENPQPAPQSAGNTGDCTNPFLYAAGGAAAGVIAMKAVEKSAPYVKKGAVKAATAAKNGAKKATAAAKIAGLNFIK